jgi:hypothetical protein
MKKFPQKLLQAEGEILTQEKADLVSFLKDVKPTKSFNK